MAERGATSPLPVILAQSRDLLRELERGDPTRAIRLDDIAGKMVFSEATTGKKVGSLDYDAVHQKA